MVQDKEGRAPVIEWLITDDDVPATVEGSRVVTKFRESEDGHEIEEWLTRQLRAGALS